MNLKYDKESITGKYDDRNLTVSKSGKYFYPSKKMFIEFLKQFSDVKADVDIWSVQDVCGDIEIHLELKYKVPIDKPANTA